MSFCSSVLILVSALFKRALRTLRTIKDFKGSKGGRGICQGVALEVLQAIFYSQFHLSFSCFNILLFSLVPLDSGFAEFLLLL